MILSKFLIINYKAEYVYYVKYSNIILKQQRLLLHLDNSGKDDSAAKLITTPYLEDSRDYAYFEKGIFFMTQETNLLGMKEYDSAVFGILMFTVT